MIHQVKSPSTCSPDELNEFVTLVNTEGEVDRTGLLERVTLAEKLVLLRDESGCLAGVSGLKRPSENHKSTVFTKANATTVQNEFDFEIGWVVVAAKFRGHKLSRLLISQLLSSPISGRIYATTRADNSKIQCTLKHFDFLPYGCSFLSERGGYELVLWVR